MASFDQTITRRGLIASATAALALPSAGHAAANAAHWTKADYEKAMKESGRPVSLSDAQFDTIQKRRPAALKRIEAYLKERLGSADPAVLAAFAEVPREYFHYQYPDHRATPGEAYEDTPKPWALGYGSALSDYLGQAYMTQVCQPKPGDVTLEIGTGSGFQSSLLSRIVKDAYTIEIIQPLGTAVDKIFAPLGYDNVHGKVGEVIDLRLAKQERLTAFQFHAFVAEQLFDQRHTDGLRHFLGGTSDLRHDLALNHLPRAHRHRGADLGQSPLILRRSPMALEALRGHADARTAAVGQPLC